MTCRPAASRYIVSTDVSGVRDEPFTRAGTDPSVSPRDLPSFINSRRLSISNPMDSSSPVECNTISTRSPMTGSRRASRVTRCPESAIQVMAGSGLLSFVHFARKPYSEIVGAAAENILPFTRIESCFIGSRYGEKLHHVPREADFVTQTNPSMRGQRDYYWWIKPDLLPFG